MGSLEKKFIGDEKMYFEITIPVLNEEKKFEDSITKTINFLHQNNLDNFKIIVVDNGSNDATKEIGEMLALKYENLIFESISIKGVGRALKTSWEKSHADFFGYMDLDLSTDLSHLIDVVNIFQNNTNAIAVNGSRLLPQSQVKNRKINREFISRAYNFIIKKTLKVEISDAACGFKFFRNNDKTRQILDQIVNKEWFFPSEFIIRLYKLDSLIVEIPVLWTDDHDSKVKVLKLSIKNFREIMRLKNEFKRNN